MLDYKATNLILVPAKDTSQACDGCGAKDERSRDRRTRANFRCVVCGHAAHADLNVAKSILALALDGRAGKDEMPGLAHLHGACAGILY
ncbi:MAG: transposase [Boseongicola sp. SB0662_bin_57]|nr:transposase [Boseongicola sp. SB0662_bin_57]